MMHSRFLCSLLLLTMSFDLEAAFYLFNPQDLAQMKLKVQERHPAFEGKFLELINEADRELALGPYSVMEKKQIPPSGDKHDYISLARFYWPRPNQKEGLPYIHRDCEMNPEIFNDVYDYSKKNQMVRAGVLLCLTYYLTEDERYAAHAALIARTWFLNHDTCMNPNLNFSQIKPGMTNQNHFGIIEGHTFPFLFESYNLLKGSQFWTDSDILRMEEWGSKYLEWLLTSSIGINECITSNNHASWYDVQLIYFSLCTHQRHIAEEHIEKFTFKKLKSQFAKDYSQPHEMKRKKNYYYSLFNLQALFYCALLGKHVGKDLWEMEKQNEGTLRKGLEYLLPYIENDKHWKNGELSTTDFKELSSLLLIAASIYPNSNYLQLYEKVESLTSEFGDTNRQVSCRLFRLLYPKPFLEDK